MGQGIIISGLSAVWLAGAALAAEAEAIPMTDGPHGSGRSLGSAWSMACGSQQRLVGVTVYEDGRAIAGIEALCAELGNSPEGTVWLAVPAIAEMPHLPPLRMVAVADDSVDTRARQSILRVSSSGSRHHGSRALLITIPRTPEPEWAMETSERITLKTGHHGREIRCSDGAYVQGLRTGTEGGKRSKLVALQLLCTRGNGRIETVGAWVTPQKSNKNNLLSGVLAARTQCGGGVANPHDGAAARALIGMAENGRVVSLGVTCARVAVAGPVSRAVNAARVWLANLSPAVPKGKRRIYRGPQWYAGSDVAVCKDGTGRGYCAQASANRFCTTMNGAGAASFYVVGGFSEDAIAAGGKRCPSGACRAFQQIICAG